MFRNLKLLRFLPSQRILCEKPINLLSAIHQLFHEEFSSPKLKNDEAEEKLSKTVKKKYKAFRDEDSDIIYDVEEEKQRFKQEQTNTYMEEETLDISLKRGLYGVFDIEDLVDVLRKENAIDIFVCSVPKNIKYVDYMCVVTGRSFRHMVAIAEFVRKVYKVKRNHDDILPKIEGEKSSDWIALDLGNIALHIFSRESREIYDLESLWSVGSEYDSEYNKPKDPLIELFEKNSIYLNDLQPKEVSKDEKIGK